MAGTVTDQLKRICRKMGGLDVSGTVTDLLAKIESLSVNNLTRITSAIKPTTRVGGSSLVNGDVWIDTANRNQYFFDTTNGWLSPEKECFIDYGTANISATTPALFLQSGLKALIVQEIHIKFFAAGNLSATDFWTAWLTNTGSSGNIASSNVTASDNGAVTNYITKTFTGLSLAVPTSVSGFLAASFRKNAAAPNISSVNYQIKYREVAP